MNHAAGDYDRWFERPWGRYASNVEAVVLARAIKGTSGVRRILDAGCGTARFTAALSAAARGAVATAIDPDPQMLDIARRRVPGGAARAVIERLPFPDAAFDLSAAITVLEFVDDPVVALDELSRVTRPGGYILVGALNPRSPWGMANRNRLRSGSWHAADFIGPRRLRHLGQRYGSTTMHRGLYAPGPFPGLFTIGPTLERLRHIAPGCAAFQLILVEKRLDGGGSEDPSPRMPTG